MEDNKAMDWLINMALYDVIAINKDIAIKSLQMSVLFAKAIKKQ